ncbi:MAG: DEAD/DEAH box helicase [Acidocella sp. 20-57-95]|nr:MAG: DEAD/DEAH box helicase [Acidocella sp. 20-57-95]OYV58896.1 MAG: DEAD/DEAH box helicase [Acidocella sp. 21-58-7]HQT63388.1 DEAD/DEAH box helicase [Acidocella sp.]HQU05164.1 DEAD/DEAH box helicase [Acidocella sp.]
MTEITFESFGFAPPILQALSNAGFNKPTPIQAGALPAGLAGKDVLGIAQTGTGKTAAFALPILQAMATSPMRPRRHATRALILSPTRELAVQIEQEFKKFGTGLGLNTVLVVGGVGRTGQVNRMSRGADIVVGTPGRICDLMNTRHLLIDQCQFFVLDEADRMLDLGFMPDIRKVVSALPSRRQSAMFSATMPKEIASLAEGFLREPTRVSIQAIASTPVLVDQTVHFVEGSGKRHLLASLLRDPSVTRAIVFTRTKRGADRVALQLNQEKISATAMHGNLGQNARQRALDSFKDGSVRVLVATDLAARGIDVAGVSHVFNYELPNEPESYVHRIGRTARNGAKGIAVALCDSTELAYLNSIEKLTGVKLTVASGVRPAHAAATKKPAPHPDLIVRKPKRPQYAQKSGGNGQNNQRRPAQRAA